MWRQTRIAISTTRATRVNLRCSAKRQFAACYRFAMCKARLPVGISRIHRPPAASWSSMAVQATRSVVSSMPGLLNSSVGTFPCSSIPGSAPDPANRAENRSLLPDATSFATAQQKIGGLFTSWARAWKRHRLRARQGKWRPHRRHRTGRSVRPARRGGKAAHADVPRRSPPSRCL